MSQPIQVSLDLSATAVPSPSYAIETSQARPDPATTNAPAGETVTLSAEAIKASASSNLLSFANTSEARLLIQVQERAAFRSEFPLQQLLDQGYSASEIAVYFGLPTAEVDPGLDIHTFSAAA